MPPHSMKSRQQNIHERYKSRKAANSFWWSWRTTRSWNTSSTLKCRAIYLFPDWAHTRNRSSNRRASSTVAMENRLGPASFILAYINPKPVTHRIGVRRNVRLRCSMTVRDLFCCNSSNPLSSLLDRRLSLNFRWQDLPLLEAVSSLSF